MMELNNQGENENSEGIPAEAMSGGDDMIETGFEAAPEHSPQKSALMLLLLIVAVGGGGIWIMHKKAGPSAAEANTETVKAGDTINAFLTDGGKSINEMKDVLRNTEKVVQNFLEYPSMTQVQLEELKTNPFEIQKPKIERPQDDPKEKDRLKKLEEERLAAIAKAKQEIETAAGKLQLQSILYSSNGGTCLIGGRPYSQGQQTGGFVIDKIDRNSVTVSKGGYSFTLTMQQSQ